MQLRTLDMMRDCIKDFYMKQCKRGDEFNKARHALISEMKRLGCGKDEIVETLTDWSKRLEKPLTYKEIQEQIVNYVNWCFKKDAKIGCTAMKDYCIGEDRCEFKRRVTKVNLEATRTLPFDMAALDQYLNSHYRSRGYLLSSLVRILWNYQTEKKVGELIYISFRTLSELFRKRNKCSYDGTEVRRLVLILINEGVLTIAEKGKAGTFGMKKANGYRFLKWIPPGQDNGEVDSASCFVSRNDNLAAVSQTGRPQ